MSPHTYCSIRMDHRLELDLTVLVWLQLTPNTPTQRPFGTLENMLKFTIQSVLESCTQQFLPGNGSRWTPAPLLFGYLLISRQPYNDVQNPTQLQDNISPSKLSTTYRPSSTPDQTPKSTSNGSLATQQFMGMKWQISMQSRQLNSLNTQSNHTPQLPISRGKFSKLDYRNGNICGRLTTGASPTAKLQKVWRNGFPPSNQQNYPKPTK